MADPPKKPRSIKDLKARLGKTIVPQTENAGPMPPPNLGQGGSSPVPSQRPPGFPGADVAPPPFLQKKKKKPSDPFAAGEAPAAGPREVRLVLDERPVEDHEVGRVQRFRTILISVVVGLVAIGLGYGGGSTMADRRQYNAAVRDGTDVFHRVQDASGTVQKASRLLNQAVETAKGGPGKAPAVDYQAMRALRALKQPFNAGDFARKRYQLFKPATVDDLFEYYNDVNQLWTQFTALAATTLPKQRQALLDASAGAAGELASQQTGCVPDSVDNQTVCGLVYLHPREEGDNLKPGQINVSLTPSGRVYPKTVYTGQDLQESPSDYVILTDTQRSLGVLGSRASAFAEYQRDLLQAKKLMEGTVEVQGRLERELGEVASLQEVWTL